MERKYYHADKKENANICSEENVSLSETHKQEIVDKKNHCK